MLFDPNFWPHVAFCMILVDEIDSDDEWIVEKETPIIPPDLCLLEDNELFNVDVVKVVSSKDQETQVSLDSIISSHSNKKET